MDNLIIGGASNYGWDELKYWVNSIKKSGFSGDIVLVATNITKETIDKLESENVKVELYGRQDQDGNVVANVTTAPHVERFFHIWNYLRINPDKYNFVITTDTRDVVFQSDPIEYLKKLFENCGIKYGLVAAGEGLKYKDETWNHNNFLAAFDPVVYDRIQYNEIFNVGVIAGTQKMVQDLLLLLYQLSVNRRINIVDQAVYNFIIQLQFCLQNVILLSNDSGWTTNLATTIHAIRSGSGDIGQNNDPTSIILYGTKYMVNQPDIADGVVYTHSTGLPSVIVHQYDRVNGLAEAVCEKYN
jgi:hypothetical protein